MRNLLTVIFSLFFLASCVEEIVMSPEERRAVNVECVLENSETQTLHLNYTAYMSEDFQTPVEDAAITVKEYLRKLKDKEVIYVINKEYKFQRVRDGIWSAEFSPAPGARYDLEIYTSRGDTITASTYYVGDTTMFRWYDELEYVFPEDNPGTKAILPPATYSTVLNMPEYSFNDVRSAEFPLFRFYSESIFPLWIYGMDYDPRPCKG